MGKRKVFRKCKGVTRVKSHERKQNNGIVTTTNETYPWSSGPVCIKLLKLRFFLENTQVKVTPSLLLKWYA